MHLRYKESTRFTSCHVLTGCWESLQSSWGGRVWRLNLRPCDGAGGGGARWQFIENEQEVKK